MVIDFKLTAFKNQFSQFDVLDALDWFRPLWCADDPFGAALFSTAPSHSLSDSSDRPYRTPQKMAQSLQRSMSAVMHTLQADDDVIDDVTDATLSIHGFWATRKIFETASRLLGLRLAAMVRWRLCGGSHGIE